VLFFLFFFFIPGAISFAYPWCLSLTFSSAFRHKSFPDFSHRALGSMSSTNFSRARCYPRGP